MYKGNKYVMNVVNNGDEKNMLYEQTMYEEGKGLTLLAQIIGEQKRESFLPSYIS